MSDFLKSPRLFFSIIIANILDHYDSALYIFMMPVLSRVFFPQLSSVEGLLLLHSIKKIIRMLTRPISMVLFGYLLTKYCPKKLLIYTLQGISISTFAIALLPGYSKIGVFAPILLIMFRSLQNSFASGEQVISELLVLEQVTEAKFQIKASGFYLFSTMLGISFSSFAATLVIYSADPDFYWRIAFIVGMLTSITATYLRIAASKENLASMLNDTSKYQSLKSKLHFASTNCLNFWNSWSNFFSSLPISIINIVNKLQKNILYLLKIIPSRLFHYLKKNSKPTFSLGGKPEIKEKILNHKITFIKLFSVNAFSYSTYVIPFIFFNYFIPIANSNISLKALMPYNTFFMFINVSMIPILSIIINRENLLKIMLIVSSLFVITIIPIFMVIPNLGLFGINLSKLWIMFLGVVFSVSRTVFLIHIKVIRDRYFVNSISEAFGTEILGRSTSFICLLLWYITNSTVIPGIYVALIAFSASVVIAKELGVECNPKKNTY
ncbi:MFS transporter [Rickettsia endosymbiont of Cardiosporidium cionae]|nr:MFS transporter [Rickettsia endosymbiont of Cardiosporidium cionae]